MFRSFHSQHETPELPILGKGHRWVWASTPTDNKGGADAAAKPDDNVEEDATAKDLNSARNAKFASQIDTLVQQDKLSTEVASRAKKDLESNDQYRQSLGKLVASKKMDGSTYELARQCLTSEKNAPQILAKKLISGKFSTDTFNNAVDALDNGDVYEKGLARRLAHGTVNGKEFDRALSALGAEDKDERWAAQQLSLGDKSAQWFRSQMNMNPRLDDDIEDRSESQKDAVSAQQKTTHDKIASLMLQVDTVFDQLPEQERTRPLKRLRQNLVEINNKDRKNHRALTAVLRQAGEQRVLDAEDIKMIRDASPASAEEFEEFETALQATSLSSSGIDQILRLKREEAKIEKDAEAQDKLAGQILEVLAKSIESETLKQRMIESLSKSTGIKVEEGAKIQYVQWDPAMGNIATRTIKKVEFKESPIIDTASGDVMGTQPTNVNIYLDNGEVYNMGRFMKWVDAADVHEVIDDQQALEKALQLEELGLQLKPGQDLDYTKSLRRDRRGHIIPERSQVKIVSIDDQEVVLSEGVVTQRADDNPNIGLEGDRVQARLSLGEFAKWARRNEAIPKIDNVNDLREKLRHNNTYRSNKLSRDAALWPAIAAMPGEVLQAGNNPDARYQIKKVNDDEVTFASGDTMTLPQFLNWVRDNEVERANPEDLAGREAGAMEQLGEQVDDAVKQGLFDKYFKQMFGSEGSRKGGAPAAPAAPIERSERKGLLKTISPFLPHNKKPYGPVRELMSSYTWVSPMDLINLGKEIIEFIKRRHQRNSKNRYGTIGSNLPGMLGTEFARVQASAENEEVNQYKEGMGDWGTWQILDKLHTTSNKDEAKACFIVLTEKGELRWDDIGMWKTLNRLTAKDPGVDGNSLYVPPTNELHDDPDHPGNKLSSEDLAVYAIDALWGEGTWSDWYRKNVGSYDSNKSGYEHKAKQLEADPKGTGGLKGELKRLLQDWKKGKYVNPQEYEELVDFAFMAGKLSAEDKLFYLFEGLTARCPGGAASGQTLLHIDRIGAIEGKYLNNFPLLDFLTNKGEKPFHPAYLSGEMTLEQTKGGFSAEDLEKFRDQYFKEESKKCTTGDAKGFSEFLWEWMMVDPNYRTRLSKGLRHAENMDHDDAPLFIPPAPLSEIENFTGSVRGNQKFWTNEGYKNGYAGFNQYLVSLSNRVETLEELRSTGRIDDEDINDVKKQVVNAIQGYFLYDSYLSGRKDAKSRNRARLAESNFDASPVNDSSCSTRMHKEQLDSFLKAVAKAYNIYDEDLWRKPDPANPASYNELDAKLEKFVQETLPAAMQVDGGEKALAIIQERKMKAAITAKGGKGKPDDPDALRGMLSSNRLAG
jgi:hypothetical protein